MSNSPLHELPGSSSLVGLILANGSSEATSALINYTAVVDPTINDDQTEGYAIGSQWINTASDTIFFCTDATTGNANWTSGGGMGSNGMTFAVTQNNSFAIGDVIRFNGTTYVKAQADNVTDAEVIGVVQTSTSTTFTFTSSGFLLWTAHGFTSGDVLFLSPTIAGTLQNTNPATIGQVSRPIAQVLDANNLRLFDYRGISVGADNTAKNDRTFVTIANESASLANSRQVAVGSGVVKTDNGAGSTISFALDVHGLSAAGTLAETDEFPEWNATAPGNKKITVPNLRELMTGVASADIASATTTDLGTLSNSYIRITGTTAITSFGSSARTGSIRNILFAAALTLTYNSSSLILPGSVSITTAAGDTCLAVYEGSGNWRVLDYTLANGKSIVGTGSFSNSQAFTASATFTPTTSSCLVILIGGGGSGASDDGANGGGASGGSGIGLIQGLTPGTPITVTCGAGGTAVSNGNPGHNGSSSTFGTYMTCTGGTGGGVSGAGGTAGIFSAYDATHVTPTIPYQLQKTFGNTGVASNGGNGGNNYWFGTGGGIGGSSPTAGTKGGGGGSQNGGGNSGAGGTGYCLVMW
jgi:hypothetical protein